MNTWNRRARPTCWPSNAPGCGRRRLGSARCLSPPDRALPSHRPVQQKKNFIERLPSTLHENMFCLMFGSFQSVFPRGLYKNGIFAECRPKNTQFTCNTRHRAYFDEIQLKHNRQNQITLHLFLVCASCCLTGCKSCPC